MWTSITNREARERAWQTYERLSNLDDVSAFKLGAEKGPYDKAPTLRFDEAAQDDFVGLRTNIERRLRWVSFRPHLRDTLRNIAALFPRWRLLITWRMRAGGPVSQRALLKALAATHYLETHARRVYGSADEAELGAAKAILRHIMAGNLKDGFTARDVHQHGWAHLTERRQVGAGLSLLTDLDYLADVVPPASCAGRTAEGHLPDKPEARGKRLEKSLSRKAAGPKKAAPSVAFNTFKTRF